MKKNENYRILLILFTAFLTAIPLMTYSAIAGPLEPPPDAYDAAGNPVPTMQTLEEIAHAMFTVCVNAHNRYADNHDGTVTDCYTNTIWLQNANCFGEIGWNEAHNNVAQLSSGQCGLNDGSSAGDWRLPTIQELERFVTYPPTTWDWGYPPVTYKVPGEPFTNVMVEPGIQHAYWSTTRDNPNASWLAECLATYGGYVAGCDIRSNVRWVWPIFDWQ